MDRLYVRRKRGEKKLASIDYFVDAAIHRLEKYTK